MAIREVSGTLGDARGLSLVEMVTVIGLMSILMAIVSLDFHSLNRNRGIESEAKQMQADFDNVRLSAMTTKKNYAIVLNPTSYAFLSYSSEGDPGTPSGPATQLKLPIQQFTPASGSYSAFSSTVLSIDARGCLTGAGAPLYIAVDPGVAGAAVNTVVVQTAKTNVGAIEGGSCVLK